MPWSRPSGFELLEPLVARRGGEHGGARALRELDRRDADASRAGLDEHGLALDQVTELEEAVVRGAERHGHARARDEVGAVGDRPRDDRGRDEERGVRSPQARRDDALPDEAILDAVADLADGSCALVPDDVGSGGHLATRPVEGVAALDADRLDLDEHTARVHLRDRGRPRTGRPRVRRSRNRQLPSLVPSLWVASACALRAHSGLRSCSHERDRPSLTPGSRGVQG